MTMIYFQLCFLTHCGNYCFLLDSKKICKMLRKIYCLTTTMLYEIHLRFGGNVEITISNPCKTHEQTRFMPYHHVVTTLG